MDPVTSPPSDSVHPRQGGRRYWGAKFISLGAEFPPHLAGIGVAAFLLQNVTATLTGAAFAAFIQALPWWLFGLAQNQLRPRSGIQGTTEEKVAMVLFVTPILWPIPLLVLASAVAPGFNVHGFWSYLATALIIFATNFILSLPAFARLNRLAKRT